MEPGLNDTTWTWTTVGSRKPRIAAVPVETDPVLEGKSPADVLLVSLRAREGVLVVSW